MSNQNYSRSITVKNTANAAFMALTQDIEKWWTKPDRPLKNVGDRAKFTFPPSKSFWTFEATDIQQNLLVEMRCVDAMHIHEGQPEEIEKEWLDTVVVWKIFSQGDETTVSCEHIGLVPELRCYNVCETGWDMFFVSSLKAYLDTGVGHPHSAPS